MLSMIKSACCLDSVDTVGVDPREGLEVGVYGRAEEVEAEKVNTGAVELEGFCVI